MLDRFLQGRVRRISPEAPVPIVEMDGKRPPRESPGGAANVAANLVALGARAVLFSVTGEDEDGTRLRDLCVTRGVDVRGVERVPTRPTTVKTRVVAQGQQIVRLDLEVTASLRDREAAAVYARVQEALPALNALIVSDYAKGVVVPGRLEPLIDEARHLGVLVAVDPRVVHLPCYAGADVVTPNRAEVLQGAGRDPDDDDTESAARSWIERIRCGAVLVTLGAGGMQLVRAGQPTLTVPTRAIEVYDVTGAGDTAIAALTLARSAGLAWPDAVAFANTAAGIAVGKRGTAVVTPEDLHEAGRH